MYQRQSRKKDTIRRVAVYTVMASAVIVLLIALTLTVLGYRFNFQTQQVEQTGLIQYNSLPTGAVINVDGKLFGKTQTKGMVLPGQHQFSMSLDGYETWQKTLDIEAGTVTWLSYARLVPINKKVITSHSIPRLSGAIASRDNRYMAGVAVSESGQPLFVLIDIRNSKEPKVTEYPLDMTSLTGVEPDLTADHTLSAVEWSRSSRHVLLKYSYKTEDGSSRTDWLRVDRDAPSSIVNISKIINLPLVDMRLADDRSAYALQENGDVRRISVDAGTISRPLLSNVKQFDIYDNNTVAYIGENDQGRMAAVWKQGWKNSEQIMSIPSSDSQSLSVRVSSHFNKDTVVVGHGSTVFIYRGTLSESEELRPALLGSMKRFTLNRPLNNLQISDNGRFILAEDDSGFISYDLERLSVSQEIKKYDNVPLRWLGTHHIWQIDESSKLVMQEFDGLNTYRLMPVSHGYDVLISHDNKYLYGFHLSEDGMVELRRLSMTLSS